MSNGNNALEFLQKELSKREKKNLLSFDEYLAMVQEHPERVLRNIFQQFYDLMKEYVSVEGDEYSEDPESIGFVNYDFSRLFVEGADNPFFADTPFANRLVMQAEGLKQGFQQNRVYVYDGPSGCGKSTFLNNMIRAFEAYTKTPEGQTFETVWEIDINALKAGEEHEGTSKPLVVPCPSHDYPILIIPRKQRADFLKKLLPKNSELKKRIFEDKDYAWLFQGEACTICKSIFGALLDELDSVDEVLGMVKTRPYKFNRRRGEGVSIFNPGDKPVLGGSKSKNFFTDEAIQNKLNEIFGLNTVRYMYSPLAKTNNGIYVLMDVKQHNQARLTELHNVVSEGVHKVGDVEERIHSLFFALMNEEDKHILEGEMESFKGRIQYNHVSYVLEPETEANIYRNIFGKSIDEYFLPRVLENFARVVISSRMNTECEPQEEWIPDIDKYSLYCDQDGLLLRMELYSNNIPNWLSDEDRRNFTAPLRKAIIAEGQKEGKKGYSGRESIALFRDFFSSHVNREDTLINMEHLTEFFKRGIPKDVRDKTPKGFLASLVNSYDYAVLNEVQEALYFYNKEQISQDILNYLCMISYDIGDTVKCRYTNEELEVTTSFIKTMGSNITGRDMSEEEAWNFANEIQKKYVTVLVGKKMDIIKTDLYKDIFEACVQNLKNEALKPFLENKAFREGVKSFGSDAFEKLDSRLKMYISHMMTNLIDNFGYSERGAKEICLYVLDNDLANKFSAQPAGPSIGQKMAKAMGGGKKRKLP